MRFRLDLFFILFFCLLSDLAVADDVLLAVASNFSTTMKKLEAEYEKNSEHKLTVTYASSGKHYAQIINGAPFDVLLSADQNIPTLLVEKKLALKDSRLTYAQGRLVLWTGLEPLRDNERSTLMAGTYSRLALANPNIAPYGQAAMEVLAALDISETSTSRWVRGENVSQTFQFVSSGNAELGFVALSQVLALSKAERQQYWSIPESLYRPIQQDAVLLKRGESNDGAKAFLRFLKSDAAKKIISQSGYRMPSNRQAHFL